MPYYYFHHSTTTAFALPPTHRGALKRPLPGALSSVNLAAFDQDAFATHLAGFEADEPALAAL